MMIIGSSCVRTNESCIQEKALKLHIRWRDNENFINIAPIDY